MTVNANTYPKSGTNPTIANSDGSRANIGFCFSGGGSRALTCAWGQMLGLETLNLIDKARYISSVSGGTWASSIYNYLPDNITDDELLGAYYPPENLSLEDGAGKLNVNNLNKYSLGRAPEGMRIGDLICLGGYFLVHNYLFDKTSDDKYLWAFIVGKLVLEPYGLRSEGEELWSSSKFFTLSPNYAKDNFPRDDAPSIENFFFLRSGRPFLIMNDNIMKNVQATGKDTPNIVQLPNQVTPVSGGAQGQTPDATLIGGGSVESYGYSSTLEQESAEPSPVEVTISQPYSLIDIVSTSSAFFADTIAGLIHTHASDENKKKDLVKGIEAHLNSEETAAMTTKANTDFPETTDHSEILEKILEIIVNGLHLENIIPTYNYWPIEEVSKNREMGYTDGGTLDNTGVLGLLAQSDAGIGGQDPINIVTFDNTDTPLEKKNGNIIAASQIAPLFGIDFDTKNGEYKPFTDLQKDPTKKAFEATSLTAVFDNSAVSSGNAPFDNLVKGLYAASCGEPSAEKPDDSKVNTEPAFYQIKLTTVANTLANVTAGRTVYLFFIQNAKIMNWQNNIGDENLKNQIVEGQESDDPFYDFQNFPYYSTFTKIGLYPKESNTLSQMWAWAISDDSSPLKNQLRAFIDNASQ